MQTMGQRVVELEPVHGFAAETTAATVLLGTAHFGMPVGDDQVSPGRSSASGRPVGRRGVRWGVARGILIAWILTMPSRRPMSALAWLILEHRRDRMSDAALHLRPPCESYR